MSDPRLHIGLWSEDVHALALLALYVARDLDTGRVREAIRGAKLVHAFATHLARHRDGSIDAWEASVPLAERVAPAIARVRAQSHRPWCTHVDELEAALRYALLEQKHGEPDDRH